MLRLTEGQYVDNFRILLQSYLTAILDDATIFAEVSRGDVETIFSGVEDLYHLHHSLHGRLQAALQGDANTGRYCVHLFVASLLSTCP